MDHQRHMELESKYDRNKSSSFLDTLINTKLYRLFKTCPYILQVVHLN